MPSNSPGLFIKIADRLEQLKHALIENFPRIQDILRIKMLLDPLHK